MMIVQIYAPIATNTEFLFAYITCHSVGSLNVLFT